MIAAVTFGVISDYFGRKTVLMVCVVLQLVFALVAAAAPNYGVFLAFRFLNAYCMIGSNLSSFIVITEVVGPDYRAVVGSIFWCIYGVGIVLLSIVAYFVTDYRYLQLVLALMMVPCLFYIWLVPESPRWLVDHQRLDKAVDILQFMADVNHRELPENVRDIIQSDVQPSVKESDHAKYTGEAAEADHSEKPEQGEVEEADKVETSENGKWHILFVNRTMLKTLCILMPAWIASSLVYWGISFNIGDLSGNLYVNVIISGAVEIPANVMPFILVHYIGRKKTQVFSLSAAGLFCLVSVPFVSEEGSDVVTYLALTGKFFIVIAYTTIFFFTVELFPTPVRNIAHGICNFVGNLAGLLAPFMGAPLMEIWLPLPLVIFGLVGILAGTFE